MEESPPEVRWDLFAFQNLYTLMLIFYMSPLFIYDGQDYKNDWMCFTGDFQLQPSIYMNIFSFLHPKIKIKYPVQDVNALSQYVIYS